ncbi:hypothetical protein DESUT3_34420 [Desulfuromonas versatilis]|uniref:histidine kinase n=1 Tax=Desulfuromonas versatilis TaxID=2802975 RepID=A0ABM8HVN2_9BACT|nr:PAS domain S-box protein [Desulfuromonas versatilis]BCR06373.1 hypothetical protein DESUT3_34420 [Desulfuromonas versatilis]
MDWLFPAVISALACGLVMVLVFAFLHRQYRDRHLALWGWSWLFFSLRFVVVLLQIQGIAPTLSPWLIQAFSLASGLLILQGCYAFIGQKASPLWIACGFMGVVWLFCARLADFSFFAENLPIFAFYALVSIWAGGLLLKSGQARGPGKHLTGWGLILWGLHKLDYPFLRPVEWFAPWGFLIAGVLSLTIALGMLLTYFQRVRDELLDQKAKLRQSREYFRTLVEAIPQGVIECDTRGRITYANAGYCRMKGKLPGDIIDEYLWDMVTLTEGRRKLREKFIKILAERPTPSPEILLNFTHDHKLAWRQLDWAYLQDDLGQLTGFIALVTDITERIHREEALRAANQTLEALFHAAPTPICALDLGGRVTQWNPAAEKVFGWSREELLDRAYPLVPEERSEEFRANLQLAREGQSQLMFETVRLHKDGDEVQVRISSAPLRSRQDEVTGVILVMDDITAVKRAEAALKKQATLHQTVLNAIPAPIFFKDSEGIYIGCNDAFAEFLRRPRENIVGQSVYGVAPAELADIYHRADMELMQRSGNQVYEAQVAYADGTRRDVVFHKSVFQRADGRLGGLVGAMIDISERKQMETALRESERKFRAIFDQTLQFIGLVSPEGILLEANRSSLEALGLEESQVQGKPFCDTPWWSHSATERDKLVRAIDRARQGELVRMETSHPNPAGGFYQVDFSLKPVIGQDGAPAYLIAEGRDISRMKQAQSRLLDSETRFRRLSVEFQTLLDGIPERIIHLSPEMKIIWANRSAAAGEGRKAAAVTGHLCHQRFHHSAQPHPDCPVQKSFRSGRVESAKITDADGSVWGVKAFPQKTPEGQVASVIEMASDITERIQHQQEAERTGRLASLGELSAGVAHEINNPNGLILLNLPFLSEAFADAMPILDAWHRQQGEYSLGGLEFSRVREEIPKVFEEMIDSGQRIRAIVEDLKNFVRRNGEAPRERFDLNRAVQTSLRLTSNTLRQATERFTTALAEQLPPVLGNSQRIEQVLVNLIQNACQALPDRNRGIHLETAHDAPQKQVVLRLRDEGCGIPPQAIPRITDPFFTTKRDTGGTGLGLSVSARIVKDHGGSLSFDSAPGKGTCVTLSLPVFEEDSQG